VALISLAVLVPLVAALLVLVNVRGGDEVSGSPVADVAGEPPAPRGDLPPVEVDTPDVTPEAELACPVLMRQLPLELAGESSRMVDSDTLNAYAWGDPAVVLVCGVAPPAGYVVGSSAIQVNGVQWYVDTTDPETVVWTTVDRLVPVEVRVPASTDSALVTAASSIIATAIPYTEPAPGPLPPTD
jgi:hypothetical protein